MTTTAPTTTTAPVRLREHWAMPIWVIADDPVTLAQCSRVLSEHELCVMAQPYGGDLPAGALELWAMGALDDAAEVQLLLAAAGIPAVVAAVEVLDLETGMTIDMCEPTEDPADAGIPAVIATVTRPTPAEAAEEEAAWQEAEAFVKAEAQRPAPEIWAPF